MSLKEKLLAYQPYDEKEKLAVEKILYYLENESNLYTRDNITHHFTASPWIINEDNSKVLMIHHNIYQSWGWCGGHSDGDVDLLHVAIREGKEETGIKNLYAFDSEIFAIDILPVPEHNKNGKIVKKHEHINITFLCVGDEKESLIICPQENSGVMWISKEDINTYVNEEIMKPVYKKLKEKTDLMYKR